MPDGCCGREANDSRGLRRLADQGHLAPWSADFRPGIRRRAARPVRRRVHLAADGRAKVRARPQHRRAGRLLRGREPGVRAARQDHHGPRVVRGAAQRGGVGNHGGHRRAGTGLPCLRRAAGPAGQRAARPRRPGVARPAARPGMGTAAVRGLGGRGSGRVGGRGAAAGAGTPVARCAAAAPGVELAGVAAYEGGIATVSEASRYLGAVRSAVTELADAGLLPEEVIVTAGGSAYFDLVAAELGGNWLPGHRLRVILRSGAYVSHDNGLYPVNTPFNRMPGALEAALEIWAQVTSVPEPGLALAGMGKREAPYDAGLPVPLRVRHGDGGGTAADGLSVTQFNDHHAFLSVPDGTRLTPGDLICFGISHPCTAFDKWPVIPVIDDGYTVTDLIRTYF